MSNPVCVDYFIYIILLLLKFIRLDILSLYLMIKLNLREIKYTRSSTK